MGPFGDAAWVSREKQAQADRQQARVDRALQAGWVIRHDTARLEFIAARELLTARTLDALLDMIEGADGG